MSAENARSTPLVTTGQACGFAHVSATELRRWVKAGRVTPVACAVRTRALLYPLSTVMRAERDTRLARILSRADRKRLIA